MYIQEDGYETDPRKFTDMMHGYMKPRAASTSSSTGFSSRRAA